VAARQDAKSGSLTFAAGETSQTITVAVKGDRKVEWQEVFYLNLPMWQSTALGGIWPANVPAWLQRRRLGGAPRVTAFQTAEHFTTLGRVDVHRLTARALRTDRPPQSARVALKLHQLDCCQHRPPDQARLNSPNEF
jgi:hypothetical protein